jgi:hypothetical protein
VEKSSLPDDTNICSQSSQNCRTQQSNGDQGVTKRKGVEQAKWTILTQFLELQVELFHFSLFRKVGKLEIFSKLVIKYLMI